MFKNVVIAFGLAIIAGMIFNHYVDSKTYLLFMPTFYIPVLAVAGLLVYGRRIKKEYEELWYEIENEWDAVIAAIKKRNSAVLEILNNLTLAPAAPKPGIEASPWPGQHVLSLAALNTQSFEKARHLISERERVDLKHLAEAEATFQQKLFNFAAGCEQETAYGKQIIKANQEAMAVLSRFNQTVREYNAGLASVKLPFIAKLARLKSGLLFEPGEAAKKTKPEHVDFFGGPGINNKQ